jgi:hypothetical protein
VEDAVAKAVKVLDGVEGPIIAVHLRGGDKRQENAELVRLPVHRTDAALLGMLMKHGMRSCLLPLFGPGL